MELSYKTFKLTEDTERLSKLLLSQDWPFHVNSRLTTKEVHQLIEAGNFTGDENQTFWILNDEEQDVGLIRLFEMDDLGDGSPLFDLRILRRYQSKGVGERAVNWLTNYLFESCKILNRIEGTTRADNYAMRKVFGKCGYAKEGHYRKSWPGFNGHLYDTVRYAILRDDWLANKITPVNWNDEL